MLGLKLVICRYRSRQGGVVAVAGLWLQQATSRGLPELDPGSVAGYSEASPAIHGTTTITYAATQKHPHAP